MKKCKACGSQYQDSKNKCPSCGSGQFNVVCENCGTAFDDGYCPTCGVQKGDKGKDCPTCGKHYFSAACPDCGYTPNKGNTVVINNGTTNKQEKKKGVTVWKVLLWIFFLPIMGSIAIWKSNMKKGLKIGLIVAIWAVMIIAWIISGNNNSSTTNTTNTSGSQKTQTEIAVEDEVVNKFVIESYKTQYPVVDISDGNINTKFYGHANNCYIEMLHVEDNTDYNIKISINSNTTDENKVELIALLPVVLKILDPSLTDDTINNSLNDLMASGYLNTAQIGKVKVEYYPATDNDQRLEFRLYANY